MHSLYNCDACYNISSLQTAYPGKPVYEIVNVPPLANERDVARKVLAELNPIWESCYSHSFVEAIPRMVQEYDLVKKA